MLLCFRQRSGLFTIEGRWRSWKKRDFWNIVSKEIAAKTTLPLPHELLRCELQCSSCIIKKKISSCFSRSFTSIHASSLEDVLIYAVLVMKTVHGEISTKKTQRPTRIHIQYANSKYVKIQWYEYKMGCLCEKQWNIFCLSYGNGFLKVETNRTKRCKHCKEEFLKVKML